MAGLRLGGRGQGGGRGRRKGAGGRRVGKKLDGTLVQGFLYRDGIKPVVELDGSCNVVSRFVYGSNPITPDYVIKGGSTYKIFSDQIGSPRVVVDVSSGSVVERIDYDERGNTLKDTNAGFIPFPSREECRSQHGVNPLRRARL